MRGAITSEMWEVLNATWLELQHDRRGAAATRAASRAFFDWVKERSHLFRGVTVGTALKDEAFQFNRLGTFLERADNTARILDVKYHVLLPERGGRGRRGGLLPVGGGAALGVARSSPTARSTAT